MDSGQPPQVAIIIAGDGSSSTNALVQYLARDLGYAHKRIYVVSSDPRGPEASVTHVLEEKVGFTAAMQAGWCAASQHGRYDAYWFLSSEVAFEPGNDILQQLVDVLFSCEHFAQVAPQHESVHQFMEHAEVEAQPVEYLEPIATLVKASTLEAIGPWDLELTHGWGVDYDYGYRIRCAGRLSILTNRARIGRHEHRPPAEVADFQRRAAAEMHAVLGRKYGDDWQSTLLRKPKYVPLILSCDRDPALTAQFTASYRSVQSKLARPVVVIDISSSSRLSLGYIASIAALNPTSIYIHPLENDCALYESVQEAVHFGFQRVLEETSPGDMILFLEDDVLFSSKFIGRLHSQRVEPDTGFVTFYQPADEYGSTVVAPERFYGTQCVLFPRERVQEIAAEWCRIKSRIPAGYDIRWSRYLAEKGYKLYSTEGSYVQHLQGTSRLHGQSSHVSNRFIA